jgi:hypothetical protein
MILLSGNLEIGGKALFHDLDEAKEFTEKRKEFGYRTVFKQKHEYFKGERLPLNPPMIYVTWKYEI